MSSGRKESVLIDKCIEYYKPMSMLIWTNVHISIKHGVVTYYQTLSVIKSNPKSSMHVNR